MIDNPTKSGPGMSPDLSQRMELRLSPQMVQAMEILQLTALELELRIKQELEENPTLELIEKQEKPGDKNQTDKDTEESDEVTPDSDPVAMLDKTREETVSFAPFRRRPPAEDNKWEMLQNIADKSVPLQDYLYQQFNLLDMTQDEQKIAYEIIYNISDDGYLKATVEEIAQGLQITADKVEQVLHLIQQFNPAGVGARNLQECLLLQLAPEDPYLEAKKQIITDYLPYIKKNRLPRIANRLDISPAELKNIVQEITQLNPHPGVDFSGRIAPEIIPDVVISEADGDYDIKLNTEYLPQIRVSKYYQELLADKTTSPETKEYIKKKIESANQIVLAIRLRQKILLRIVQEIIKSQKGFLERGINYLKPLKMEDIAKRVGVHTSTVSRAISARPIRRKQESSLPDDNRYNSSLTNAKYIQTPRGIFSMKFFFARPSETSSDELKSQAAVIQMIKELIEKEDKVNPISDKEITALLRGQGVNIVRRTVAKYRQILNIPGLYGRKHF